MIQIKQRARPVEVSVPEPEFRSVLQSYGPASDRDLAKLIEQDGRSRLLMGLPCDLRRYSGAVPDLVANPIALDAAIDVSLKSLARTDGCDAPEERHAESLLRSYPELAGPIRLATLLNEQYGVRTAGIGGTSVDRTEHILPRSLGTMLGSGRPRYELRRVLGRGFSGTVFEAVDHLLSDESHSATVAVKLIAINQQTAQRQAAEATKARRVDHPNVVRVLDRGLTDESELFLVYELVPGGDLHQWFARKGKSIPAQDAVAIVESIALGVQAAHDVGLVHCDLKPANVLMTRDGRARVSDFGVAARADDTGQTVAGEPRMAVGTLPFAAPEQIWKLNQDATPQVDVYGLGGVLFYLLTGTMPNGETDEEVRNNFNPLLGRSARPSARAIRPKVDPRLDRICARAMEIRPVDRYPTAAAFAADLRAWLEHRPIGWMKESGAERGRLWVRRSPVTASLCAACALAIVAGSVVAGVYSHKAKTADEQLGTVNSAVADVRQEYVNLYKKSFMKPPGAPKPNPEEIRKELQKIDSKLPIPPDAMKK